MSGPASPNEEYGSETPPPLVERSWWRPLLLATLFYTLATILMTWPYAARLADHVPSGEDPLLQIWIARWVQHAFITDPVHLYDANAFYPRELVLAYSDSNVPAALFAAPVYLLTKNAILANNLLVLGTFVLAGLGMYLLVGQLTGNRAAGLLAGLAFAFLPYRYAHIYHLNQLGHAWTPWVLYALVMLLNRQRWRWAIVFGVLLAIQALSSFYIAFQIALAVTLVVLVALLADPRARSRRFMVQLVGGGALALALVLPFALPYLQVRDQQLLERTVRDAEEWQATPSSYLKVERNNLVWSGLNPIHQGEDVLFPGGLALVGAVTALALGWRRHRAMVGLLAVLVASGVVLSLGPTWNPGTPNARPLPFRWLFDHVALFHAMRAPARFGILANFAIVALGGLGAALVWERLAPRIAATRRVAIGASLTALVSVLLVVELISVPQRLVPVDTSAATAAPYQWLAAQPGRDPVMYFPANVGFPETAREMYWSTLHWKPLVEGYSGFLPHSTAELTGAFTQQLRRADGSVAERVNFPSPATTGLLREIGVRYLLVHRYGYKREDWPAVQQLLDANPALERAAAFNDADYIYLVRPDTASQPPASVDLFAPTVAVHNIYWEPTFIVNNQVAGPALVGNLLKQPAKVTIVWRDERGGVAKTDQRELLLAAVAPPGETVLRLQPDQPQAPGRYTVGITVSGGLDLHRSYQVDVFDAPPAGEPDGPAIAFNGAQLSGDSVRPGSTAELVLEWTARHATDLDLTIFAQLIGPDGKVWGQYDAPAGWPAHRTSTWQPGERVTLPWPVPLKAGAPPGRYRLLLGMYRHTPAGVERVPVRWPSGDATEYWAGEIDVR